MWAHILAQGDDGDGETQTDSSPSLLAELVQFFNNGAQQIELYQSTIILKSTATNSHFADQFLTRILVGQCQNSWQLYYLT